MEQHRWVCGLSPWWQWSVEKCWKNTTVPHLTLGGIQHSKDLISSFILSLLNKTPVDKKIKKMKRKKPYALRIITPRTHAPAASLFIWSIPTKGEKNKTRTTYKILKMKLRTRFHRTDIFSLPVTNKLQIFVQEHQQFVLLWRWRAAWVTYWRSFLHLLHYYTKEPDDGLKITCAEHKAYYWFLS